MGIFNISTKLSPCCTFIFKMFHLKSHRTKKDTGLLSNNITAAHLHVQAMGCLVYFELTEHPSNCKVQIPFALWDDNRGDLVALVDTMPTHNGFTANLPPQPWKLGQGSYDLQGAGSRSGSPWAGDSFTPCMGSDGNWLSEVWSIENLYNFVSYSN